MTGGRVVSEVPLDGALLLRVARAAIEAHLDGRPFEPPAHPALDVRRAAFVTIRLGTALRGCVGCLTSERPLGRAVAELAVASATRDPRFPPLRADEWPSARVSISVLSDPFAIDADAVEPGRHGVILERWHRRGVLLPQVATEHGLSREALLAAACHKAGLPAHAWREPDVRLSAFTADHYDEDMPA